MTEQPLMPHLKDLPHLFQTIRQRTLSGRLTWKDGDDRAHIFFQNGYPIHAQVDMYGQIGEDAIDWVLTRQEGNFQWAAADAHFNPAHSITTEMSENLDRLVTIMVEGEILNRPTDEDYDLAFFGIKPKVNLVPPPAPAVQRPQMMLRFPPGEPDAALSEQLAGLIFADQITMLQNQQFAGYLYYQPAQGSDSMALGLVVLEDGVVTLAHATDLMTDATTVAREAYTVLAGVSRHVQAYRSSTRVLRSYRAIMQSETRTPKPATREALQQALTAAKRDQTTGAIALHDADHGQEVYILLAQGQAIGLVAPESNGNRLIQLPQNSPLPLGTPAATLTVLTTPNVARAAAASALAPDMYATLVQAFQIMSLLATQFLGQERAAATIVQAFRDGIEQGAIPTTWQGLVQPNRASVAWPAAVTQLGADTVTLNALTFLWNAVFGSWSATIGHQFLDVLLRAWGARVTMLRRAPITLPFADALAAHDAANPRSTQRLEE